MPNEVNLDPITRGEQVQEYMKEHGVNAPTAAKALGFNSQSVYDQLSLLKLPDDLKAQIRDGSLTVNRAKLTAKARKDAESNPKPIKTSVPQPAAELATRPVPEAAPLATVTEDRLQLLDAQRLFASLLTNLVETVSAMPIQPSPPPAPVALPESPPARQIIINVSDGGTVTIHQ